MYSNKPIFQCNRQILCIKTKFTSSIHLIRNTAVFLTYKNKQNIFNVKHQSVDGKGFKWYKCIEVRT